MDSYISFTKEELENIHSEVLRILWKDFACERIHQLKDFLPKSSRRRAVTLAIHGMKETYPYTHKDKTYKDHSDDEIKNIIRDELKREPTREEFNHLRNFEYFYLGVLSQDDINMIEKYILKLFDTFMEKTSIKDIHKYILEVYQLIIYFKVDYNNKHFMLGFEEIRYKFSEKDIKRKVEILKQKVWEVYNIIGLNVSSAPHHEELEKVLRKVYEDPERYILKKQSKNIKNNNILNEIKSFLNSLPLKDKKQIVDEFCKKIK